MGILDRISNILRANINDLLDHAEDPEKMLEQIIRDMEGAIKEARSQVAEMIAQEKLIKADLEESRRLAAEWEKKAELAVSKGADDLALEALRRKNDYDAHTEVYEKQWTAQKEAVSKLKSQLQQLEAKYEAAVRNKEVLIARRKRAAAQRQIAAAEARLSTVDYSAELERMERRIMEEEARAAAMAELAEEPLEERFEALEEDTALQEQLAALKAKVLGE
ncbi:MAG TPA: PspA/IM30 family protein [Anaerolineae bacterium]|nr:PspA/IM30 family protein [Anaerolineae bacterium]